MCTSKEQQRFYYYFYYYYYYYYYQIQKSSIYYIFSTILDIRNIVVYSTTGIRWLCESKTWQSIAVVVLTLTHRYTQCSLWSQDRFQQLWSGRSSQEEKTKKNRDNTHNN